MVDMFVRDKGMQWRVNRRSARVQVIRAVRVVSDHPVFGRRLRAAVLHLQVEVLQYHQLFLVQRGKVGPPCRTQVTSGSFYPENIGQRSGERIRLA